MSGGLLDSLRVLDLGGAESDAVGRLFADLGADVLKIEPPEGSPARRGLPSVAGASISFALDNANKRSAVLDADSAADRDRLMELAGGADIVVDGGNPGGAAAFGTSCAALAERFGQLVALSVTDFGTSGPYASWQATDPVLVRHVDRALAHRADLGDTGAAAAGCRVGDSGGAGRLGCACRLLLPVTVWHRRIHRLFAVRRRRAVTRSAIRVRGPGRRRAETVQRAVAGPAAKPADLPDISVHGRIRADLPAVGAAVAGMRGWLGEPERFADPKFDTIAARYAASTRTRTRPSPSCSPRRRSNDLVAEGQRRGVPIAAVLRPAQALSSEHFRAVGALADVEVAGGAAVPVPVGPFVINGEHAGYTDPAPAVGADETSWARHRFSPSSVDGAVARPFDGMRILDLGVIVAGGELGRLFADLGAEVIKIESAAYPDGLRQTPPGQVMSRSWALTHRNEYSLGLDLRQPAGAEIFEKLVAGADAVFANFKPGTLGALGFSDQRLQQLNPRIVLAESSAFGATGPWSERMGYGPLVRATTGVTWLWTSEDAKPEGSSHLLLAVLF